MYVSAAGNSAFQLESVPASRKRSLRATQILQVEKGVAVVTSRRGEQALYTASAKDFRLCVFDGSSEPQVPAGDGLETNEASTSQIFFEFEDGNIKDLSEHEVEQRICVRHPHSSIVSVNVEGWSDDDADDDEAVKLRIYRRVVEPPKLLPAHESSKLSSEEGESTSEADCGRLDAPIELWPRSRRGSALDSPFAILSMISPSVFTSPREKLTEPSYYLYDEPESLAETLLVKTRKSEQNSQPDVPIGNGSTNGLDIGASPRRIKNATPSKAIRFDRIRAVLKKKQNV